MKKKTINKITLFSALGLGVILLASCTANFSSSNDQANILFTYDMGTTRYESDKSKLPEDYNNKVHKEYVINDLTIYTWQDLQNDYHTGDDSNTHITKIFDASQSESVYTTANNSGIKSPDTKFWFELDQEVLDGAWKEKFGDYTFKQAVENKSSNVTVSNIKACLDEKGGYYKFNGKESKEAKRYDTMDSMIAKIKQECAEDFDKPEGSKIHGGLRVDDCPNTDFTTVYKNYLTQKYKNVRSCIAIYDDRTYGNFGWNHNKIPMTQKSWGYAWSKGLISGLIVYPIAWLTETFSRSFGMNGWGQLGSILCVTFIVRTFLLLVSLKSTIGQQKMQMLQPELNKIQAKYPNANTNAAQKQRMSQEQMALYKKNKINPLGTLLVLVVQFPLFIGVWGAMQGSASLATDKVMNLYLSDSIWATLQKFPTGWQGNTNGCWTAFTLIILMSIAQFVSMKLPQWMQKAREKKLPKLTANPAQSKSQKQMKWFGYIMLVMIIIMGFTLPAGMGVYWLAGALFSIIQTLIMQFAMNGDFKRFGRWVKSLFKKKTVDNGPSNN